jgi:hypothetical protein
MDLYTQLDKVVEEFLGQDGAEVGVMLHDVGRLVAKVWAGVRTVCDEGFQELKDGWVGEYLCDPHIVVTPVSTDQLLPGDLFSFLGPEYWNHVDPDSLAEKVYVRMNGTPAVDQVRQVYRIEIVR